MKISKRSSMAACLIALLSIAGCGGGSSAETSTAPGAAVGNGGTVPVAQPDPTAAPTTPDTTAVTPTTPTTTTPTTGTIPTTDTTPATGTPVPAPATDTTAQAKTEVAPYFTSWSYWGGATPSTLMQAKSEGGLDAATIAFGIDGGGCTLSGGMENIMSGNGRTDVQQFVAGGGRVILSFGGANGSYLESVCSEDAMYDLLKNIIDTQKVYALDFDVEGSQLTVASSNTIRNKVLKRLQTTYPNLYLSFTLPADPTGVPASAVTLLRGANDAGVRINVVNIMAMDYGAYYSNGKSMGDLAITAANATYSQIKGIFTGRSDAQLWAMIGITPMIGVNDVSTEVFRQADAQKVVDFAKQKKLGLLAFWSLQRDRPGSGSLDGYSQVNTQPYEFYQIMKAASATDATAATGGSAGAAEDVRIHR